MANRSILKLLSVVFFFGFAVLTSRAQTICGTIHGEYATYGSRWKTPVHLVLNPIGMPPGVKLEDAQSAIDAWTRYAEVEITLRVDLTAAGGNTHDGASVVSFGGSAPGPGVVAQTFNSVNGDEITESDIVFFEGKEEVLNRPGQFASIFCHELGHTLGVGHSYDSISMMFNVAHGAERGATLAPDDRAAIQFLYAPKASTGPVISNAKCKAGKLTVAGEVENAVDVWVNGETYSAKRKGGIIILKCDFPMVSKGYNVLVIHTPTASSDPFFF